MSNLSIVVACATTVVAFVAIGAILRRRGRSTAANGVREPYPEEDTEGPLPKDVRELSPEHVPSDVIITDDPELHELADLLEALDTPDDIARKNELLLQVARKGTLDAVVSLLEAGADPNATDSAGMTPLLWAMGEGRNNLLMGFGKQGHMDVVKALLSAGADPNAASPEGTTALMWAAEAGLNEIVGELLSAGADRTAQDSEGLTARRFAHLYGHDHIVEMLATS